MKVRMTVLMENDKPKRPEHTEKLIRGAWRIIFDELLKSSKDPSEKITIESVEVMP